MRGTISPARSAVVGRRRPDPGRASQRVAAVALVAGALVLAVGLLRTGPTPSAPDRPSAAAPIPARAAVGGAGSGPPTVPSRPAASEGYVVEGPFGYEVVPGPSASPTFSGEGLVARWTDTPDGYRLLLVRADDGYYDEGPQGYEWRLRRR
jgi:hypothetical protein